VTCLQYLKLMILGGGPTDAQATMLLTVAVLTAFASATVVMLRGMRREAERTAASLLRRGRSLRCRRTANWR
jgi:hypothetical protein